MKAKAPAPQHEVGNKKRKAKYTTELYSDEEEKVNQHVHLNMHESEN